MREEITHFAYDVDAPFSIEMAGVSYCDGKYVIRRKKSRICCIEYVIKGAGTVWEDHNQFAPRAGDVYLLHIGRDHYYYSDGDDPWEKIWFNVSGPLVESLMDVYRLNQVNLLSNTGLLPLFQRFLDNARSGRAKDAVFSDAARIFLEIVQTLSAYNRREQQRPVSPIALALKQSIDNLVGYRVSIDALVAPLYCSKSYAIRVFKSTYGVTPYAYLLDQKMKAAKGLLRDTRASVAEIADRLGFCDSHYFSNSFRKAASMTPSQYRKQQF